MNSSEYLSKDIFEDNFLKVFSTLFRIQWLLGACRVDARDRFVTAPTLYQKLYTIVLTMFSVLLTTAAVNNLVDNTNGNDNIYYLCLASMFIVESVFLCNIIHVRFFNNDANVKMYMKMQEFDKFMKIENNVSFNGLFGRINTYTAAVILFMNTIIIVIACYAKLFLYFGAFAIIMIVFTFEISFCGNLFIYFFIRIRFINAIITNHINKGFHGVKTKGKIRLPTVNFMEQLADQTHDFETCDTDIYLKRLFNCFQDFQEIYNFQVGMQYNLMDKK